MQGLGIVGGHYAPGDDHSLYDLDDWEKVDKSALTSMSLSFGVTRTDCNTCIFDVNFLPVPKCGRAASATADYMLRQYGQVLLACTVAHGQPPASGSWDGGLLNSRIQSAFLGLCDPNSLQAVPFFQDCVWEDFDAPYFAYRLMVRLGCSGLLWLINVVAPYDR